MKIKHWAIPMAMSMLVLSSAAQAGPGRGGEGHRGPSRIIEALNLSGTKKVAVETIFANAKAESKTLRENKRRLRKELHASLDADAPNEAAIMATVERLGESHTELRKLHIKAMLKVRALLSAEERMKLRQLRQERRPCAPDADRLCPDAHGKERRACLRANEANLSDACKAKMQRKHRRGRRGH